MNVLTSSALLVVGTAALTFALIACALAPPSGFDSRDTLVLALGASGLVLGGMALRRFFRVHRTLMAR